MQYQFKDQNDIKIFILYLLKNVGKPLTYFELNDIVVQDGLVSCIDFAECLGQLQDTDNVAITETEKGLTYEITEQGKRVANTLESEILGFIRTRSLKSAMRYLSFKERGIRIAVTTSPRPDGRIDMIFTIREKDDIPMEIKIIADNEYQARQMSYNFQDSPEIIFRSVFSLLSGDAGYFLK